jgi:hypothetical protein
MEQPGEARELLKLLTDLWIEAVALQMALVPRFEGGYGSNEWYGLWVPGTNATTQNDLAVLISPRMYGEFLSPCDSRICSSLEYPIMHFHSNSTHLVDPVLAGADFAAIQFAVDPGEKDPTVEDLLPHFRRVQEAGKPLIIQLSRTNLCEMDKLLDGLSPRGLLVWARVADALAR